MLREARRRAGVSQAELADRLDMPTSTVSRWERGHSRPSFESLLRAIRACGLDVSLRLVARDDSLAPLIDLQLSLTPAERLAQNSHTVNFIAEARHRMARRAV